MVRTSSAGDDDQMTNSEVVSGGETKRTVKFLHEGVVASSHYIGEVLLR